jgi:hypothetical protein
MSDGEHSVAGSDSGVKSGKSYVLGPIAPCAVPMAGKKLNKRLCKLVKKGALNSSICKAH